VGTNSLDFRIFSSSQAVQIHLAASLHEQQNAAAAGQEGRFFVSRKWGLVDQRLTHIFPALTDR